MMLRRFFSSAAEPSFAAASQVCNRNPRNLERLRIAYKPDGYHLEKPGKCFWHKLELSSTRKHVTAQVIHYLNGPIITASTSEWAIKKQLYRSKDSCAYINLGIILAQRCLQFGITEIRSDIVPTPGGKVEEFLTNLTEGGVVLQEPERFRTPAPWDAHRHEKPWEVTE